MSLTIHVRAQLTKALEQLAAPAETQIRLREDLGLSGSADELALQLDDILPAVLDGVPDGAARILRVIDARLSAMSGETNASVWTYDGLRHESRWSEIRRLASAALEAL